MPAKNRKKSLGQLGEEAAREYLINNSYNIVRTNYRVGRLGEVDIIATCAEFLCFIEVKTRTNTDYGLPCEAVNQRKQNTIRKIASIYLSNLKKDVAVRFDIVEIIASQNGNELMISSINLLQNAF